MENFSKIMVDSKTETVAVGYGAILKLVQYIGTHAIAGRHMLDFQGKRLLALLSLCIR